MLARLTTRRLFAMIASGMLTLAAVSAIHAAEAQWPRFHGPNGDNISRETGLLKSWPEDGPNLLWKAEGLGEGYATVAVADGLIYTAGNKDDKTMLTALDLSGKQVWQKPVGPAWTRDYPGTRATPTIADGRLYYETPLGDVVCLNAKDGEKIWSVNILEKFGGENIRWGLSESIVLDGDRLMCCPGGPDTTVVALKRADGSLVWKSPSVGDAIAYATPRIAEFAGVRMVLTLTAKAIVAVNADNGELLFRHPHETSYDVNVLTPIVHDGQVFVSTGYGRGSVALRLKASRRRDLPRWFSLRRDAQQESRQARLPRMENRRNAMGRKDGRQRLAHVCRRVVLLLERKGLGRTGQGVARGSRTHQQVQNT